MKQLPGVRLSRGDQSGQPRFTTPKNAAELNKCVRDFIETGWKFDPLNIKGDRKKDPAYDEKLSMKPRHGFTRDEFKWIKTLKLACIYADRMQRREEESRIKQWLPWEDNTDMTGEPVELMTFPDLCRELDTFYGEIEKPSMTSTDTADVEMTEVHTVNDKKSIEGEASVAELPAKLSTQTVPFSGMKTKTSQPFIDFSDEEFPPQEYVTPPTTPMLPIGLDGMKTNHDQQPFTDSGIFTMDQEQVDVDETPPKTPSFLDHELATSDDDGTDTEEYAPYDLEDFTPAAMEYNKAKLLEDSTNGTTGFTLPNHVAQFFHDDQPGASTRPPNEIALMNRLLEIKRNKPRVALSFSDERSGYLETGTVDEYPIKQPTLALDGAIVGMINPVALRKHPKSQIVPSSFPAPAPRITHRKRDHSYIATNDAADAMRATMAETKAEKDAAAMAETKVKNDAASPSPHAINAMRIIATINPGAGDVTAVLAEVDCPPPKRTRRGDGMA